MPASATSAHPNRRPDGLSRRAAGAGSGRWEPRHRHDPRVLRRAKRRRSGALVNRVVADVQGVINSGRAKARCSGSSNASSVTYADVPTIAATVLGPQARSTSASDMGAFVTGIPGLHGTEIRAPFPGIHRRPDQRHGHPPDGAVRRGHLAGPHSRQFARSIIDWRVWDGAGRPLLSTSSSKA
jgi:hypothetical protein